MIPLALIASVSEIALYVQVLEGFPSYVHYLFVSEIVIYSLALYPLITSYLCVVYLLDVHGQSICYVLAIHQHSFIRYAQSIRNCSLAPELENVIDLLFLCY